MSNITKGGNSKSKDGRIVILVRNTSSCPILQFYKLPSKYSEGHSSFRAAEKSTSNKTKVNNSKSKKAIVVILISDTLSGPVLHFYEVSAKYSKEFFTYRADTKSMDNHCQT